MRARKRYWASLRLVPCNCVNGADIASPPAKLPKTNKVLTDQRSYEVPDQSASKTKRSHRPVTSSDTSLVEDGLSRSSSLCAGTFSLP